MAQPESNLAESIPPDLDLLAVIRRSGILHDRQFEDVRAKVLRGTYPQDPQKLSDALIGEGVLTEYQARRFLRGKAHGLMVSRYVIQDRVGSGSMGRVYMARHMLMDRLAAIKVVAPENINNDRVLARFQREMRLVGRLDHPNVVRAFDADKIGDLMYIVMEYVPGTSLSQRLRKRGPLPIAETVDHIAQAAAGLQHAHDQGVVHRDVKPSNLLIRNADRVVKVADLGLAALVQDDESPDTFKTAQGIAVGTIDYMSPEQATGQELDGRSDIYSLGCTWYHILTGQMPFQGDSPIDRLGARINGTAPPVTDLRPDVPRSVVRVLDRMMTNKPEERFQTAGEVAEILDQLLKRTRSRQVHIQEPKPSPDPEPTNPEAAMPPDQSGQPAMANSTLSAMAAIDRREQTLPSMGSSVIASQVGSDEEDDEAIQPPDWLVPFVLLAKNSPIAACIIILLGSALLVGLGVIIGTFLVG